ncbi:MAG: transposase [Methylococcales bacterium]
MLPGRRSGPCRVGALAALLCPARFRQRKAAGQIETDQLLYRLPKPRPDGQTVLDLTPVEFLDQLAVLIPPPRKHRHRYCPAFWLRLFRRERNRTAVRWSCKDGPQGWGPQCTATPSGNGLPRFAPEC